MKNYDIYVRDLEPLKKYGFREEGIGERQVLDLRSDKVWPLHIRVDVKTKRMHVNSVNSVVLKIICDLYTADVIYFKKPTKEVAYNMRLTKEERDLIMQHRKEAD